MVEAYLTDCSGFGWQIVEKTVRFFEYESLELSNKPALPMDVSIPLPTPDRPR